MSRDRGSYVQDLKQITSISTGIRLPGSTRLSPFAFPLHQLSHCINCDDAAFDIDDIEQAQQFRNGCDFVRFLVDSNLSKRQTIVRRTGANQMGRSLAFAAIMRTPHGLSVNGDDLSGHRCSNRFDPSHEAFLELSTIQADKNAAKGIVRWDAVRQLQICYF